MSGRIQIDSSQLGPPAFSLVVTEHEHDALTVIAVTGELDLATASELKRELDLAARAGRRPLVDLARATFLDSTALNVLLGANRRIGANARHATRLPIACSQPNVLRILEFSGLDAAFAIFETLDQALAYAKRQETCTG